MSSLVTVHNTMPLVRVFPASRSSAEIAAGSASVSTPLLHASGVVPVLLPMGVRKRRSESPQSW
ncbi:hypothetical protein ACWFRM_37830 [Streptomyces sp. NPDC055144]